MKKEIEIIDININDLIKEDNIEIIEIDDIEIIEIEEELKCGNLKEISTKKINNKLITKIRKKLTRKKIAIITTCCATILVTLTGIFLLNNETNKWYKQENPYYTKISENTNLIINEENYNTILVNGEYEEKGATLIIDGQDVSKSITVDTSNLNTNKVGTYQVIYSYQINKNEVKTAYRTINVIDNEPPKIALLGSNVYTMLVNEEYIEEGVLVTDNSNEELLENVIIDSNLNISKPGNYYIKYTVKDNSNNTSEIYRTVIVKNSYTTNTNTIIQNSFTDYGISLSGCVQNNNFQYKMLLKNKNNGNEKIIELTKTYNHYYKLDLDLTQYENGTYEFYIMNDNLELLTNNMNDYNRIVRAHVGDKLVTMNYEKNKVNMTIEDFEYLYDVVIDPGHGGSDTGAVNGRYYEKNINLEQSLYEKQRYEQHGLKVLLLREDDTYGTVLGNSSWEQLDRKGYAVGYYSVVSKITYSNHHNSSTNPTSAGWEILVPAKATYEDLKLEHQIAQSWSNMYIKTTNPYYRFYTKDYETATSNNKEQGQIYNFEDYYAVIRIPNKIFNEKNVIFEGAYVNNTNDMYWYYNSGNWKKLSEVKIKAYVESLGIDYIEP